MWVSFRPRLCRGCCLFAASAPGRADPVDAGGTFAFDPHLAIHHLDQFLGDGQSQISAAELGVTLPLCLLEGAKDLVRF